MTRKHTSGPSYTFRWSQCIVGAILVLVLAGGSYAAFQAAVITLVFPPGARATGLGEAFTALADDANATFFNPAGLGQAPLANSWIPHLKKRGTPFYAVASYKRTEFSLQEQIWAGTADGVLRYNGKAWEEHEIYLPQQEEHLLTVVRKYLESDDEQVLHEAAQVVREYNDLEMQHYRALSVLARGFLADSADTGVAGDVASSILDLTSLYRDSSGIREETANVIDSSRAGEFASRASEILESEDVRLEDLVEIKIPFSIAVDDSVTALVMDPSENVWIGTNDGLYRYDGSSWSRYTVRDGLPSDVVVSLAVGPYGEIAVGTDLGIAVYAEGLWESDDLEGIEIENTTVEALAFAASESLYVGTHEGLWLKAGDTWTHYDTADGLLSRKVTALMYDSDAQLWIGGDNGVTIYTTAAWKRYKFPDSRVYTIAEYEPGEVWIGTNRGAITYTEGATKIDAEGKSVRMAPEWKAYHSKNALEGDHVYGITVHGEDVWLATDKAVTQYDFAEMQLSLFWEMLLPALKLRDLWHMYSGFVYPTKDWGTFGLTLNFINFGENTLTDEEGVEIARFRSWEGVFGLCYGLEVKEDFSLGLNVKYVHSALAPGIGPGDEGVGRTFAIDAAMLKRNLLTDGLDLGVHLQNMGPPIFYIDRDQADPIPFTIILGLLYRALETPLHDMNILMDLKREIAKNYLDRAPDPFWKAIATDLTDSRWTSELSEVNIHTGLEYWYVNFLAARMGFLFDYLGERYELTLGMGLKYGNMDIDFSYIHSPEGFMKQVLRTFIKDENDSHRMGSHGVRHGQPRFSLVFQF